MSARLAVFSKTLLKTSSRSRNVHSFTCFLYKFVNLCLYDAICIAPASRCSSIISRSLIMTSLLASSGIPVRNVGILIFVGIIASIL